MTMKLGKGTILEIINVLTDNASINLNAPTKYQGLDRFDARKAIVSDLEKQKLN